MKRSDTKRLQAILEAEAAILRGALRKREGIVIESASEVYERMSLAGQRDLALVLGDRESRRLRYIEAAPGRIEKAALASASIARNRSRPSRWRRFPAQADVCPVGKP